MKDRDLHIERLKNQLRRCMNIAGVSPRIHYEDVQIILDLIAEAEGRPRHELERTIDLYKVALQAVLDGERFAAVVIAIEEAVAHPPVMQSEDDDDEL